MKQKLSIPNNWRLYSLEEVTKKPIVYGIVQAGPEVEDGVYYIKSTDVGQDLNPSKLSKTSFEIAKKYKRSEVYPGDIIFSLRGNIGDLSIVPNEIQVANLTQGTARISVDQERFDTMYIHHVLHSTNVRRNIVSVSKGSTFNEISLEELRKVQLGAPKLEEQRAIARVISISNESIDKCQKLIIQKELRKKWLMQCLLSSKKRLKGFKGEWRIFTANEFLSQRNELALNDGKIPLFSLTIELGVTEKSERYEREFLVKDKGVKKYKVVYPDDVVFNPANLRWGAIAKNNTNNKVLLSPIYEVLSVREGFDIDFISYLVSSPRQIAYYASIVEGTLMERMAVKLEPFLATKYLIPELEEQTAISQVLKTVDREIQLSKDRIEKLRQQKRGLMQTLLTGKKRLKS